MTELLLHVCCGPCSIMPVKRLLEAGYKPVLWFMNPNIQPLSEYLRRRETAAQTASLLGVDIIYDDFGWDLGKWLATQLPLAHSPKRCENCVAMRMKAALEVCKKLGISIFSTTLLYSRYQPHEFMKAYGENLENVSGIRFYYQDFREDWQAGIEWAKKWELYRQPYCGCIFSENERYAKKLEKLKRISSSWNK